MASGLAALIGGLIQGRMQTRARHYASDDENERRADAAQRAMAMSWDKMQINPAFMAQPKEYQRSAAQRFRTGAGGYGGGILVPGDDLANPDNLPNIPNPFRAPAGAEIPVRDYFNSATGEGQGGYIPDVGGKPRPDAPMGKLPLPGSPAALPAPSGDFVRSVGYQQRPGLAAVDSAPGQEAQMYGVPVAPVSAYRPASVAAKPLTAAEQLNRGKFLASLSPASREAFLSNGGFDALGGSAPGAPPVGAAGGGSPAPAPGGVAGGNAGLSSLEYAQKKAPTPAPETIAQADKTRTQNALLKANDFLTGLRRAYPGTSVQEVAARQTATRNFNAQTGLSLPVEGDVLGNREIPRPQVEGPRSVFGPGTPIDDARGPKVFPIRAPASALSPADQLAGANLSRVKTETGLLAPKFNEVVRHDKAGETLGVKNLFQRRDDAAASRSVTERGQDLSHSDRMAAAKAAGQKGLNGKPLNPFVALRRVSEIQTQLSTATKQLGDAKALPATQTDKAAQIEAAQSRGDALRQELNVYRFTRPDLFPKPANPFNKPSARRVVPSSVNPFASPRGGAARPASRPAGPAAGRTIKTKSGRSYEIVGSN